MNAPKIEVYVMEVKDILKDLPKIIFITYMPMHMILYKTPKWVIQNCEYVRQMQCVPSRIVTRWVSYGCFLPQVISFKK